MNKDAEGRWKVGMSNIKLKMRVDNLVPQKPLDELIKAAEPGLPNEDYISHPWNTLFDLAHFASGGSMKGMICKGRDRRPFVVEALSRPGLYLVFVELQVDRELLEEIRRKSENPEAVVELVFIWTREGSAWKMLTLDLIRR